MIQINNTLISELLLERKFACDLSACKGACCVEGDAGAPLEKEELQILKDNWKKVKPFLRKEGVAAIQQQGMYTLDKDEEYVTPLINGKECAYVLFDEQGVAKCGIERAYLEGEINFRKPISCHLYPIRITKIGELDALNYSNWHICEPACKCGSELNLKVFRFLKDALIRKFGNDWYTQLEAADKLHDNIKKQARFPNSNLGFN